jgi:predicted enzyme related to lactoylglutathione lyase
MANTGESFSAARLQLARRARAEVTDAPVVVIAVADMDRALRFYGEALGLPVRSAADTWSVLGDDGSTIALEPAADVTGGDVGIGLRVDGLAEVLTKVEAHGGNVIDSSGVAARITDPDGNLLRLAGR